MRRYFTLLTSMTHSLPEEVVLTPTTKKKEAFLNSMRCMMWMLSMEDFPIPSTRCQLKHPLRRPSLRKLQGTRPKLPNHRKRLRSLIPRHMLRSPLHEAPRIDAEVYDIMARDEPTPPNAPMTENEVFETSKDAQSTDPTS